MTGEVFAYDTGFVLSQSPLRTETTATISLVGQPPNDVWTAISIDLLPKFKYRHRRYHSELVCRYQAVTLFSATCTGSCDAGSISAAGIGCIDSQLTAKPTTMTEIEALKERVDRLEAEREQEKREKEQLRNEVKELRDRLETIEDSQPDTEIDQTQDRGDELECQIKRLVKENAQLKQRVADLETQPDISIGNENDPIGSLEVGNAPIGKVLTAKADKSDVEWCEEEIEELEAGLDTSNPTPEAGETPLQASDLTPIEQLSRADDVSEVTDSPTVERAVALFKNIADWGSKTPKGIVLKPADNPLRLLEADQDESLAWKQYYRAAETLEQLSHGSVTFFDSDKHGKMLCLHERSETFERVVNGSLTASSVGAKG